MRMVLVGAGGHARALVETIRSRGDEIAVYVDARGADWLGAPRKASDDEVRPQDGDIVVGIGGMAPDELVRRLALFADYRRRGFGSDALVHPTAWVSATARLGAGSVVLAGAVVQPAVTIGEAVIINTGAIVEHDSVVGDGTHVAPGAIVLGHCRIGCCCMIGAGSVILPGTEVPDHTLVGATTRWHGVATDDGRRR